MWENTTIPVTVNHTVNLLLELVVEKKKPPPQKMKSGPTYFDKLTQKGHS